MSEEIERKEVDDLMIDLRDVLLDGCKKHLDRQVFPKDFKEDLVLIKQSADLLYNLIKELPLLSKYKDKITKNAVEHYHLILMDLYLTFCKRPSKMMYRGQAVMSFSYLESGKVDECIKSFEKMKKQMFKDLEIKPEVMKEESDLNS